MSYFRYNVRIMVETFTTVSSKGQVVIPAQLREKLGIEAGTRIAVRIEKGHLIILEPINEGYIRRLRGSLKGPVSMVEAREREKRLEK
jgi:AbrB family looped-hinge helix DNA binding protein